MQPFLPASGRQSVHGLLHRKLTRMLKTTLISALTFSTLECMTLARALALVVPGTFSLPGLVYGCSLFPLRLPVPLASSQGMRGRACSQTDEALSTSTSS